LLFDRILIGLFFTTIYKLTASIISKVQGAIGNLLLAKIPGFVGSFAQLKLNRSNGRKCLNRGVILTMKNLKLIKYFTIAVTTALLITYPKNGKTL
jgi:hypothetical protein